MKINYVNHDHVHVLIDLPTHHSIEEAVKLLKGNSSYWINQKRIVDGKFSWGRGYGAFSVSQSMVSEVAQYIAEQEEHHHEMTFMDEYRIFMERHELEMAYEKNR
jgi:REP element-mobilizing transposase RayT